MSDKEGIVEFWKPGTNRNKRKLVEKKNRTGKERMSKRQRREARSLIQDAAVKSATRRVAEHYDSVSDKSSNIVSPTETTISSDGASKKVSNRVLSMKFMKRRQERKQKAASDEKRATELRKAQWVVSKSSSSYDGVSQAKDEDNTIICIPDDTVGNELELDMHMRLTGGRKSFGAFNKMLEEPEKLRSVSLDETEDNADHISDGEMAARYEKYIGLRGNKKKSSTKKWNGRAKKDQKSKGSRGHSVYTGLRH